MRLWKIPYGTPAALVTLLLLMPVRLQAEEESLSLAIAPHVRVSSKTEAPHYRIDQLIPFRIIFTSDDVSSEPVFQIPDLPLQNLSVAGTSQAAETRMEAGYQIRETILLYRLKAESPGRACVNSFGIRYKTSPEGMPQQTDIETHCFDIEDVPWFDKISGKAWARIAAAVTFFMAALLWGRMALKHGSAADGSKILSAEDQCLGELDAVEESLLVKTNKSDILKHSGSVFRRYLVNRYGIMTPSIGGLQLLDTIERRRDISGDDKKEIRAVLQSLTECAFGGVEPSADEVFAVRRKIRTFIANKKVSISEGAPIKN